MIQTLNSEGVNQTVKKIATKDVPAGFVECYSTDESGAVKKLFEPKNAILTPTKKMFYADVVAGTSMFEFRGAGTLNFTPFKYSENKLGFIVLDRTYSHLYIFKDYLDCIRFVTRRVEPKDYESRFGVQVALDQDTDYAVTVKTFYVRENIYIALFWGSNHVLYTLTPLFNSEGEVQQWELTPTSVLSNLITTQVPYNVNNEIKNFEILEMNGVIYLFVEAFVGTTYGLYAFNVNTNAYITKLTYSNAIKSSYNGVCYSILNNYIFISDIGRISITPKHLYRFTGTAFSSLYNYTPASQGRVSPPQVIESGGTYFFSAGYQLFSTTNPTGTSWSLVATDVYRGSIQSMRSLEELEQVVLISARYNQLAIEFYSATGRKSNSYIDVMMMTEMYNFAKVAIPGEGTFNLTSTVEIIDVSLAINAENFVGKIKVILSAYVQATNSTTSAIGIFELDTRVSEARCVAAEVIPSNIWGSDIFSLEDIKDVYSTQVEY